MSTLLSEQYQVETQLAIAMSTLRAIGTRSGVLTSEITKRILNCPLLTKGCGAVLSDT